MWKSFVKKIGNLNFFYYNLVKFKLYLYIWLTTIKNIIQIYWSWKLLSV